MIEQLKQENKVVGAKQTRRALKDHRAKRVYMAQDADPRILQPLVQEAVRQQVPLEQVVQELGNQCFRRSWTLLVPEQYGHCSPHAQVCISSALSGGTLVQRLREAQERFGRDRVVLALQRVAEDFFLPSPTGSGTPLTQEELRERIQQRQPSIFFSHELCARYFTYMSRESGAHFVLYDDASTLAKKLQVARSLDIRTVLAAWPEIADAAEELGLRRTAPNRVLR